MVDAYTLWGSALLGSVLLVTAWVPAARRSLVPRSAGPFIIILSLTWAALIMLFGVQLPVILVGWLAVLAGVIGLWCFLYRPWRQWRQWFQWKSRWCCCCGAPRRQRSARVAAVGAWRDPHHAL